jgi:hypothetical protein
MKKYNKEKKAIWVLYTVQCTMGSFTEHYLGDQCNEDDMSITCNEGEKY